MITSREIRESLARLIKVRAGLPLKVYFNHVLDAADDYVFVEIRPEKTDEGFFFVRRLRIDFHIVLSPLLGEVKHSDLLDMVDALDAATHPFVEIADRKVTVYETASHIFDDILHFNFVLEFADAFDEEETHELMQELALDLSAAPC